ncbi:hypothetical protein SAMN02799624_05299 [Paenibacillus sp. UNC496MF]|uniref:hypothetical protein n=1 Tax=Paenibacillus sp. UNC496MF TaxID=1502753 RepID=UPI0008E4CFEB|nr:hypothetical protein [Paenibacillus sp. UNC496MF]SFJ63750.1 hypothetical protein SAMN02799624_05299 [Paenibacillus sp. UNC496MF]
MSAYATPFELALSEEDLSMLDSLDQLIANVQEAGGTVSRELDELTIRKMVIRRKFMLREQERLKMLRDAIKAEWDQKIKKIDDEIANMDKLMLQFVVEKGDKLQLDVATVSQRKVGHKVTISNEDDFKAQLSAAGLLEQFLGDRPVNLAAAKSHYIAELDKEIDTIEESAKQMIKAKEEALKFAMKEMKPADKKEAQAQMAREKKEILQGAELAIREAIESFKMRLPAALAYEPESKGLSIRMNY